MPEKINQKTTGLAVVFAKSFQASFLPSNLPEHRSEREKNVLFRKLQGIPKNYPSVNILTY
jgi:hypothetical protein